MVIKTKRPAAKIQLFIEGLQKSTSLKQQIKK